jgi:hypothetical protein
MKFRSPFNSRKEPAEPVVAARPAITPPAAVDADAVAEAEAIAAAEADGWTFSVRYLADGYHVAHKTIGQQRIEQTGATLEVLLRRLAARRDYDRSRAA